VATFYYCDHDEGPCLLSERAMARLTRDPARCVAHGKIVGGILHDCADREEARRRLGRPFKRLYDYSPTEPFTE
jgi:hypothetical protein